MKDYLKFDFCEMHIYDHYLVVIINEGEVVQPKHNDFLINVAEIYFRKKKFCYISHRINSYSIDPATYIATSKIPNLLGVAVVSSDYKAKQNVEVEQLFFEKPISSFSTMEEALQWMNQLLFPHDH